MKIPYPIDPASKLMPTRFATSVAYSREENGCNEITELTLKILTTKYIKLRYKIKSYTTIHRTDNIYILIKTNNK